MFIKPVTKKVVYLVRHGESAENLEPIFQSYIVGLNDSGLKQAEQVAERFKTINFDQLISSPQKRAQQTAAAITQATGKSPLESDLFIECFKPSSINGKPFDDAVAHATWEKWQVSLHGESDKVEDGETMAEVIARADKALKFLEDQPSAVLLVVTHGHFIRSLLARIMLGDALNGELIKRFYSLVQTNNTGVTKIHLANAYEEDYQWRLDYYNDSSHLKAA